MNEIIRVSIMSFRGVWSWGRAEIAAGCPQEGARCPNTVKTPSRYIVESDVTLFAPLGPISPPLWIPKPFHLLLSSLLIQKNNYNCFFFSFFMLLIVIFFAFVDKIKIYKFFPSHNHCFSLKKIKKIIICFLIYFQNVFLKGCQLSNNFHLRGRLLKISIESVIKYLTITLL